MGLITLISVGVGIGVYLISQATIRKGKTEEQLIAEAATPSLAPGGGGGGE